MKLSLVFSVGYILSLATSTYAVIGDTYEQSVKRYGKPLNYFKDKYGEALIYKKGSCDICYISQRALS
jgi:hypothetical protein